MNLYSCRYVHKISPRETDLHSRAIEIPESLVNALATTIAPVRTETSARKTLGAILRTAGVLGKGESLVNVRHEPDGRIVAFPKGFHVGRSIWWSFILTRITSAHPYQARIGDWFYLDGLQSYRHQCTGMSPDGRIVHYTNNGIPDGTSYTRAIPERASRHYVRLDEPRIDVAPYQWGGGVISPDGMSYNVDER